MDLFSMLETGLLASLLWGNVLPVVAGAVLVVITWAIGRAVVAFERRTGIEISDAAEAKVKRAADTMARTALKKMGITAPADLSGTNLEAVLTQVVDWITGDGAGDSLKQLGGDKAAARTIAESAVEAIARGRSIVDGLPDVPRLDLRLRPRAGD